MKFVALSLALLLAGCTGPAAPAASWEPPNTFSVQFEGQMGPGGNPSSKASSGILWCDDGAEPVVSTHYEMTSGSLKLRLYTLNQEPDQKWTWNITGPAEGDMVEVLPVGTSNYGFGVSWGADHTSWETERPGFNGTFVALAHCPDPDA